MYVCIYPTYVCMHVCMYVCVCVCVCVYVLPSVLHHSSGSSLRSDICMYMYVYIHTLFCIHTLCYRACFTILQVCMNICVYMSIYKYKNACMYIHTEPVSPFFRFLSEKSCPCSIPLIESVTFDPILFPLVIGHRSTHSPIVSPAFTCGPDALPGLKGIEMPARHPSVSTCTCVLVLLVLY